MSMLRRTASLLMIAAFTLALPATSAHAGAKFLRMYKVEKHVDLEGDSVYNLKCPDGDFAIDGMWRIDQVDQDPDLPGDIREYVAVYAAYPDSGNKSLYHFKIENLAGGNAQMKLFLTCLGHNTEPNSYQVEWSLSNRKVDNHSGGPGLGSGFMPGGQQCGSGEQAVSPGFEFTSGVGRLVGSRTSFGGSEPPLGRNWSQVFVLDEPSNWKTYMRCLDTKSQPGPAGQRHRILARYAGGPTSNLTMLGAGLTKEHQAVCGDHYKGMVHGFDTTPAYAPYLYFWGMDPRIKARAYQFFNHDYSNPIGIWTGLVCFKDRTN